MEGAGGPSRWRRGSRDGGGTWRKREDRVGLQGGTGGWMLCGDPPREETKWNRIVCGATSYDGGW